MLKKNQKELKPPQYVMFNQQNSGKLVNSNHLSKQNIPPNTHRKFLLEYIPVLIRLLFHSPSSLIRTLLGPRSAMFRTSSEQGPNKLQTKEEQESNKSHI